jgi:hypothetical protein
MMSGIMRGGEMDIWPFYEATRWMLRGGEMDGRQEAPTFWYHLLVDKLLKVGEDMISDSFPRATLALFRGVLFSLCD